MSHRVHSHSSKPPSMLGKRWSFNTHIYTSHLYRGASGFLWVFFTEFDEDSTFCSHPVSGSVPTAAVDGGGGGSRGVVVGTSDRFQLESPATFDPGLSGV